MKLEAEYPTGNTSALPWQDVIALLDEEGNPIAYVTAKGIEPWDTPRFDERADFITRAVNSHDRLVTELEAILAEYDYRAPSFPEPSAQIPIYFSRQDAADIRAALAAARETGVGA